ncbi:hypothetical protein QCN29_15205 [Streptomyces sp. HNM0663]|uniref:Uncharacterized protein n=1 Tax=Streptomyces chengmaiensis TaxID=3040919 RepID=A0ABT6HN18_9ACTN|nr:hypothetical protein [Streptomyces chengmaiensis]MDH2390116.1 hypothetical protein [Streptomyces chengmaiensis]
MALRPIERSLAQPKPCTPKNTVGWVSWVYVKKLAPKNTRGC